MSDNKTVAILGAGVIGASWASLFAARGWTLRVYDPAPNAAEALHSYMDTAWPVLSELGLATGEKPTSLSVFSSAVEAVKGVSFVQESVPERLPIKCALFETIEPALDPSAVVASSASGLTLSEMQGGWTNPARFVLGHPFNPPHLIPLVEVMGNAKTDPEAVGVAHQVYRSIGKVTITVQKEVPGHVANRLQAALWREAIHLMNEGVASVEDIDTAVWSGPGLRWAAMGPTMLFHLAAGPGGLASFCERYTDSFNRWWDDLGQVHLTPEISQHLTAGLEQEAKGQGQDELGRQRDALIVAMLKGMREIRETQP